MFWWYTPLIPALGRKQEDTKDEDEESQEKVLAPPHTRFHKNPSAYTHRPFPPKHRTFSAAVLHEWYVGTHCAEGSSAGGRMQRAEPEISVARGLQSLFPETFYYAFHHFQAARRICFCCLMVYVTVERRDSFSFASNTCFAMNISSESFLFTIFIKLSGVGITVFNRTVFLF